MTKFLCGECIHNSDKGGGCLIPKNLGYVDNCNRYLPKDKPIVHTNEEYLRSCTTEQLAEWLKDTLARCYRCGGCDELAERNCTVKICYYADVVEWLKQPHNSPK